MPPPAALAATGARVVCDANSPETRVTLGSQTFGFLAPNKKTHRLVSFKSGVPPRAALAATGARVVCRANSPETRVTLGSQTFGFLAPNKKTHRLVGLLLGAV